MEGTRYHKISVWAWIKNTGVSGLTGVGFSQAIGLFCVDIIPLMRKHAQLFPGRSRWTATVAVAKQSSVRDISLTYGYEIGRAAVIF